jgi:hypothetical protein
MTLLVAWVLFPLVLALLSLGCGLLLGRAADLPLSPAALLPAGFAVIVVVGAFAMLSGATARLAAPAVVTLAVAGLALSWPWKVRAGAAGWPVAAAIGVFGVFAAPIVLSGRATFAGYIKLDDTATYLAMLDRAMQHGYNVAGLAPSTYEATLKTSLVYGYPLGSLVPLGVGRALVGQDAAWLWQPYLSFLAVVLALGLYRLFSGMVRSRPLRALITFLGAQASLFYGYALWGGVKELATAAMVALAASFLPESLGNGQRPRHALPLAVVFAATAAILSIGGVVWLAPFAVGAVVLAFRSGRLRGAGGTLLALAGFAALLAMPTFVAATKWLGHSGAFTSGEEYGNLARRLSWLQVFGIWPHGDFRTPPSDLTVTYVLVAIAGAALVAGLVAAWRKEAFEVPAALAAAAFGCVVYVTVGSPWIGAKALASASPVVLATALAGSAVVFESGRRVEATLAAAFIAGGTLWSNVLQYHEASLAPSPRLSELATIGHRFARQGPTLMTEYEAYGARHFLRTMTTEGASELRRHYIYLRGGGVADTGVSPDIDEIELQSVLDYRTLVLRVSGTASRPPSIYRLAWTGRYYEVWQRPVGPSPILEHLSLGSRYQPAAVPRCSDVLRLARLTDQHNGRLAVVRRPAAIVIQPSGHIAAPTSFGAYGEGSDTLYLSREDSFGLRFNAPASAMYGVWAGGSFRSRLEASVDGASVGSQRDQLAWPGNFVRLGDLDLARGPHVLELHYSGPDLAPGSAGRPPFGLGPFVVTRGTENRPVSYVDPADARSLCGQSLDWAEAVRG